MVTAIMAVGGLGALLAVLVYFRIKTENKIEIKNTDILLAIVPVTLWLFLTGKIQNFAFGDIKISNAIKEAATTPITKQITPLPIQNIKVHRKGPVGLIPDLASQKIEAISLELGYSGYSGEALFEYLSSLSHFPFFKYIVIKEQDGRFFGLLDARRTDLIRFSSGELVDLVKNSDKEKLKSIHGFISKEYAVTSETDKVKALEKMESLDCQTLPAVDNSQQLIGIVDRGKLSASILIEVSNKIK